MRFAASVEICWLLFALFVCADSADAAVEIFAYDFVWQKKLEKIRNGYPLKVSGVLANTVIIYAQHV